MSKKRQESSGTNSKASVRQKWADTVTVSENPNRQGIELQFNAEPSIELQPKLRAMGFRHSKSQTMWYGDNTPQAREFAEQVKEALPSSSEGPELFISPSFEAVKTNVEKREYSYVLITLQDGQIKSYIVFEPSKPKAEVIATNFARQQFGENFFMLAAKPRMHIREAKVLFDEAKIIYPEGQDAPVHKGSVTKGMIPKSPEANDSSQKKSSEKIDSFALIKDFHSWLKDDSGYAKVEHTSYVDFVNWMKENKIDLSDENKERVWNHHLAMVKAVNKLHNKIHGATKTQPYSSIYNKLMQVIPDLLKHIEQGKHHGKSAKDPKGGLMNLNYDYVGKDKNGNYMIALSHYFEQNGDMVADPDMQIRILPELQAAEAMTFQDQFGYQEVYPEKGDGKEYVDLARKKDLNKFLNQWLSNIIQQGHKIDLTKEESEVGGETDEKELSDKQPKQRFKRLHTPEEEKEILRQFGEQGFTRPFSAQEAFDKNLPVMDLAFRYVEPMEYFRDHIENLRREKIQELREQIKELKGERGVNEKKNSLKEDIAQLETELNKAEQLVQDETLIFNDDLFEIILDKARQKGYSPEGEDEISSFRDYVTTNVLDNRAIENYHKEPVTKVVDELMDEYFRKGEKPTYAGVKGKAFYEALSNALKSKSNAIKSYVINNLKGSRNEAEREKHFKEADELWGYSLKPDSEMDKLIDEGKIPQEILDEIGETKISPSSSQKAIAEDLKSGDTFLPNVLVPAGAKEPFLANNFSIYDMKAIIKNNFPHLLKITEKNLSKASALEMFELVQMAHPTDYGIKVGRSAMLNEWEKRGKEMFDELGYPTDTIYPYINIYLGYESIEPLGEILSDNNKEGNEWWAVAEHCRPIADAQKGLEIIDELIDKQKRERQTLVNSKTGKPKLEFKKLANDIAHTIENLKDSKEVLQHYLANPPEKTIARVKTQSDPLANEQGVYTEKTAGKNYESIEIPMPKGAQYEATIKIVKTSNGDYKVGLDASKKFGDFEGLMFGPGVEGQSYSTREEALKYALKQHELKLELLLIAKDSILGNEEKKTKNLNAALQALRAFAEENGISLETPSVATANIIKGLEVAYWTKEDDKYPVNKVVVNGMEFQQARLRKAIEDQLEKLPLDTLQNIADELSKKFKERRPLDTYEKGYVTTGKSGDKRKKALIAIYVDDLIVDNDLTDKANNPVMTFLIDLLFADAQKLVDLPKNIEKQTPSKMKKQSQYELNKEIESFIDKKDKEGGNFNEEEKNYIRQYTGSGGLIKEGAAERGVLYEYYTPEIVVKKMWDMAYHYGYDGGSILEPSVGTGNFLKYAPKGANVYGYETNRHSFRIAQILYPQAIIANKSFETIFFAGNIHLKDNFAHAAYSLVIGNPPYGDFTGKYAGMGEKQWTGATEYDQYFMLRGLDLLKTGGLLIYLIPSNFISNKSKFNKVKEKIAAKADFVDLYRLPNRTFDTTDIGTDIIVLKKK